MDNFWLISVSNWVILNIHFLHCRGEGNIGLGRWTDRGIVKKRRERRLSLNTTALKRDKNILYITKTTWKQWRRKECLLRTYLRCKFVNTTMFPIKLIEKNSVMEWTDSVANIQKVNCQLSVWFGLIGFIVQVGETRDVLRLLFNSSWGTSKPPEGAYVNQILHTFYASCSLS